jgi:hypothetical protein
MHYMYSSFAPFKIIYKTKAKYVKPSLKEYTCSKNFFPLRSKPFFFPEIGLEVHLSQIQSYYCNADHTTAVSLS